MSRCLLVVDVGSRMDWNLVYYEYDMKVAAIAGNQHLVSRNASQPLIWETLDDGTEEVAVDAVESTIDGLLDRG